MRRCLGGLVLQVWDSEVLTELQSSAVKFLQAMVETDGSATLPTSVVCVEQALSRGRAQVGAPHRPKHTPTTVHAAPSDSRLQYPR